jgi:hypothetical protein
MLTSVFSHHAKESTPLRDGCEIKHLNNNPFVVHIGFDVVEKPAIQEGEKNGDVDI